MLAKDKFTFVLHKLYKPSALLAAPATADAAGTIACWMLSKPVGQRTPSTEDGLPSCILQTLRGVTGTPFCMSVIGCAHACDTRIPSRGSRICQHSQPTYVLVPICKAPHPFTLYAAKELTEATVVWRTVSGSSGWLKGSDTENEPCVGCAYK